MLFYPVQFAGLRVRGLASFVRVLPRKIQQIPGLGQGGIGWQGIIPSRAAKMGSIAVDKGIAKVGGPGDFYAQLDPEKVAQHILASSRRDIRELVERIVAREHPDLWRDLPPRLRERLHQRVEEQLPDIVREVTSRIGDNIDQLLDVKLMVIRHIEANPELANKVFLEVGRRELRLIINFGFYFGFILGIPVIFIVEAIPQWWVLPILGSVIGFVTNWLAIWLIFEPSEPRKIGPFTLHGLFLRRQPDVSDVYAGIISNDIVTAAHIGEELLRGPRSDRTHHMIARALRPAVDRASGVMRPAVRVAVGTREYDAIRDSVAIEAVEYTMTPLRDAEFNREQSQAIHKLIAARMRKLSPPEFAETLRSAIREDEWLLIAHGGVLGIAGGLAHLAIFGV